MTNNQIPDSYFDYILREKKAAMRLADYKDTGVWNEDSAYDDVDLTEDEVIMFEDIFRSKFFSKIPQKGEIVTMTFDLSLANEALPMALSNVEPLSDTNRTPIGFDTSMFSSLMCDGNDLLDGAGVVEVINTKDNAQNSINYITEELPSLTVKVAQPLTENNYCAVITYHPVFNEVQIVYFRCTEEQMSNWFVKIDDTTYNFTLVENMNNIIKDGAQVSIIFFDTINGLPEDFGDDGQFEDFALFNTNIENIISTTLESQITISFPSSEGIYVVEGELKEGVTSIGENVFYNCSNLTSIKIPSSVTSIGEYAFYGCYNLTNIEIPSSVTSIANYAFYNCSSLTSIEIPNGVTSIGEYAFYYCGLTSIEIPRGINSIGNRAFGNCQNLTSIIFADNSQLTSIAEGVFHNCQSLPSIEIPSGITSIGKGAFETCHNLISIIFANNSQLTSIGEEVFKYCYDLTSIEIPSTVNSIGGYAFNGCESLTSITFGEKSQLTSIGEYVFYNCFGLTSIEIPSGVTSIGKNAFYDCTGLTSIEIPNGVTSIGEEAFCGCSNLTSIEIPNGVTSIGIGTFFNCFSLTSVEIPSSVTSIGFNAFTQCYSLTSITCHGVTAPSLHSNTFTNIAKNGTLYYPEGSDYSTWLSKSSNYLGYYGWNSDGEIVTMTFQLNGSNAIPFKTTDFISLMCNGVDLLRTNQFPSYYGVYVVEGELKEGVTSIREEAFYNCSSLTSITFADDSQLTYIGQRAFCGCTGLTSIEIPSSVTSIGGYAFSGCTGLTSIEIPSCVTKLGTNVFQNCKLTSITSHAITRPSVESYTFKGISSNGTLYYPEGSDYSLWLKSSSYYLGYYGWNGEPK